LYVCLRKGREGVNYLETICYFEARLHSWIRKPISAAYGILLDVDLTMGVRQTLWSRDFWLRRGVIEIFI